MPSVLTETTEPAWGELEPRRAGPTSTSTSSPLVGLAVGLAAVAFLLWRGHQTLAATLILVVVTVTVGRWLSPTFSRVVGRVLHAIAHGAGIALTWIFFVPFTVFLLTPVWLLLRLVGWNPMAPTPRWRGRWAPRTRLRRREFPDRLYADEREEARTWRTRAHGALAGLACCAFLAVAALGAYELASVLTEDSGAAPIDLAAPEGGASELAPTLPAWQYFETYPWSQQLASDESQTTPQYDPLLVWRNHDQMDTRYVDIEGGARVSYRPEVPAGVTPLEVWFFGGSAAFGYNQRGDLTIASDLVRLAEQDGIPVEMSNFGTVAYTNFQQLNLLGQLLTERPPPDLVVFYDGMNDLAMYLADGGPTRPSHMFSADLATLMAQNQAALDFAVETGQAASAPPDPADAAALYNQGVALSHGIADGFGIPMLTYYQPSIYTMTGPVDPRVLEVTDMSQADVDAQRVRWEQAREALDPRVIDVAGSLDGAGGTLFYDWVHHNERAAELIAASMYETLGPQLRALGGASNN